MADGGGTGTLVVLSTVGSPEVAAGIAGTLVEERLAACVNVVPNLRSVYRWKGETVHDDEVLMVMKTTVHRYAAMEERLRALHPYEVPEIVAMEVRAGFAGYLDWVGESVEPEEAPEA